MPVLSKKGPRMSRKNESFLIKKKPGGNGLILPVIIICYCSPCRNLPTLDPVDPDLFDPKAQSHRNSELF